MSHRQWTNDAIQLINADFNRSADTHLIKLTLPCSPTVQLYLKDESTHPTGSLKHRLARSLFLYGLCNNWITPDTTIIETSSGSTAISEAYFAKLLGLPFIAVMPATTSPAKIRQITFYGGSCHLVDDPTQIYDEALRLAKTAMATTWINSRTPSVQQTGAATTTLPSRFSRKWPLNHFRYRPGL
jgi:cysteine synthase A